jgi:transposase
VAYADKEDCLKDLFELAEKEHIDLVFGDEAGFSLNPSMAYGWRFKDEPIALLPQQGKRINVLGFMNWQGDEVTTFSKEGSVDGQFVVDSIEAWRQGLTKPTMLVLDNAGIHHSALVNSCLESWQEANLYVFFLPAYSPHLNRIERLWLKTKQRWLKPSDYADLATLKAALNEIWAKFGSEYCINFN